MLALIICTVLLLLAAGGVYALDFGAVLMLASAMDALNPLLVEALPEIEPIVVRAYARDAG